MCLSRFLLSLLEVGSKAVVYAPRWGLSRVVLRDFVGGNYIASQHRTIVIPLIFFGQRATARKTIKD